MWYPIGILRKRWSLDTTLNPLILSLGFLGVLAGTTDEFQDKTVNMMINLIFALLAITISADAEGCRDPCHLTSSYTAPLFQVDPTTGQVMSFFGAGDFVANDGTVTYKRHKGLVLNANPFHLWIGPNPVNALDHTKLVIVSNEVFNVPKDGKVTLSGHIKTEVLNNEVCESPYPSCVAQEEDLRFGSGAFIALDLAKSYSFGFLTTNDRIYSCYERLTFARPYLGDYAAFIYVVPLAKRCKTSFNKVAVTLDGQNKQVLYYVEDKLKLTLNNIGSKPPNRQFLLSDFGGDDVLDFPETFQYMLACITTVDFYPACKDIEKCEYPCARMALTTSNNAQGYPMYNPLLGAPYPVQMFDQVGTSQEAHVWGQGVIFTVDDVKIKSYAC